MSAPKLVVLASIIMCLFNDLATDVACKAVLGILPILKGWVRKIKMYNDQYVLMLTYHVTDNCQVTSLQTGCI